MTSKLDKKLVTRVSADNIIDFIVQYLENNKRRISVLELMARMNLWSKDTLRICRYMLEHKIIAAENHDIVLKNKKISKRTDSNKFRWLMKHGMRYSTRHNFSSSETRLLSKFRDASKKRPPNVSKLDQYYCTPETNMERLKLALNEKNCKNKSVCFMGDDDLTSLIFAMSGKFKYVAVHDVDRRILKFLKTVKKRLRLKNYGIFYHDYRKPFSTKMKFDIFFSDPPATTEAVDLVLGRATEISKDKAVFFLSWAEFLWDPGYISGLDEIYKRSGWGVTKKMPEFNEYENECMVTYLTNYDKTTLKMFSITKNDIIRSPPIQRYGITRLSFEKSKTQKLGQWNKNIYLDGNNIKEIKSSKVDVYKSSRIKQLNIDCYGCEGFLNDGKELISLMKKAAKSVSANVIGSEFKKYPVQGVTAIVFLAESHILITTYPEYSYAVVEIFLCNEEMDTSKCWNVMKRQLKPKKTTKNLWVHQIRRVKK